MTIKETYYNRYLGWENNEKPNGEIIYIMRSKNHILSPSNELLNDWNERKRNGMTWEDYKNQFFIEMANIKPINEIKRLIQLGETKDMWLVCSCWNKHKECHRFLVMDLIKQRMEL